MTRRRASRRRRAGKVVLNKTVLGLVGGAPGGGETPRVADSSAAGACRVFHNSKLFDQLLLASVLQALARKISKILTSSACGRYRPPHGHAWLFSMRGQPARIDALPPRVED